MNINATLFAQLVVFFILGWFTMKFVWPPIVRALDERAKKISDGLAAADKAQVDLRVAERRAAEEMTKARDTVSELRAAAERQATSIIEQARAEAAAIVTQARQQAETEAETASQSAKLALRAEVATLAVAGASQILRREIDAKAHADLLSQLQSELK
ncbi:MAG: F0F1 ATP synthase subunit B [Burkholderiaceae bacterium]|nr:F0F1 ATP synthase subunit B [Burkholderiaceae bacterium]MDP4677553.1 F0F1 ATP synthase subunit B [Burkholderiaceae bacterium]MDP4740671.1 F0F1 ATP synthase subunit B [Burkholderiaceae bacterium]MDP4919786.1 F0F1 ATP synthase subunit B [Burkholderiaceae bacterium]MDP4950084.1 F0F1 ATP synthase subunit B [Burkholderiaceae bacterium]